MCNNISNLKTHRFFKNTKYPLAVFFIALLIGTVMNFCKYGPYITPDTIGYFNMAQGKDPELTSLSPFYSYFLSLFPFSLISIFDRAIVSGILMFLLAFYLLFKMSRKIGENSVNYFFAFGISILSWWSFRVLGSAHADSHFYLMFLFWIYLFIWKNERSTLYLILICFLSALMVWVKLNALFLVPLLALWVIISKEKQWIYVISATIISWLIYRWNMPENILDLHLSNQVVLQASQLSTIGLFYENLSTWFQVNLALLFSDLLTQHIPKPLAFTSALLSFAFLIHYLVKSHNQHNNPIYKALLISFVYSVFFLGFELKIGYKEINYRTLFPQLVTLSLALWIYLIQYNKKKSILIIGLLITSYTLSGHYIIWQRNDVASLITAKRFDNSKQKETIERILNQNHQQIFSNSPEKIMLSFNTIDVLQIAPKNRFIEGKNYPLSDAETELERQKSIQALKDGSALVVLFQPTKEDLETYNIHGIKYLNENNMAIFYKDRLTQ
ncbi:hypothetical protein [Cyclobacterium amurskyense]|uniref:Glycosyltransferase RgtA/B/C/D-like domain-containing protein n=1 Tax=Cyclobacterium amurskyense TaxID=320787 RepID=A0A0H4PAD5_9BACT|nr:hypothetical protein [Cyclobacterium amurskyense]AKP50085.1 hypothetical protein CA2015_0620 [Cyclobacterium amurskyense]